MLKIIAWSIGLLALVYGCSFMFEQTYQYFQFSDHVGFLPFKKRYHHLLHWKVAFYIHVFSAIIALFAAFTQFLPIRTPRHAIVHRLGGRVYVAIILLLAAPTGLLLGWYAEGGISGRLGFLVLSVLWLVTTAAGFRAIRHRRISEHLDWMTRSYALTFAAITFRELQHWSPFIFPQGFEPTAVTAWLAWVPNLIVAELWIWRRRRSKSVPVREGRVVT